MIVIGGGPAGLATAIASAQHGLRPLVLEPRQGTIDKACGEGLMPATWSDLAALGAQPSESHSFVGIRYVHNGKHADGWFPEGPGRGVRRLALHDALRTRADALGIEQRSHRAQHIQQHDDHVTVDGMQARYLVAADGLRSPTRHTLGLDNSPPSPPRPAARVGLRQHFRVRPWSPYVEVHWADDAEAYITPVAADTVGLAFLCRGDALTTGPGRPFDRLLSRFPDLADRLHGAPSASAPRGAGPFRVASTTRTHHRALLVGDAAGYLDPLTGEGLKLALAGARSAAKAMAANDLAQHEHAWTSAYRRYWWPTWGLLALTSAPWARRAMVPALRRVPAAFDRILGLVGS